MLISAAVLIPNVAAHGQTPPDDSATTTAAPPAPEEPPPADETPAQASSSGTGCTISSKVRFDSRGPDALCVEQVLATLGYQFAGPDEYFGSDSANSVKAYQRSQGLGADGIVGPATGGRMGIWAGAAAPAPAPAPAAPAPAPAPDPAPAPGGTCAISSSVRYGSRGADVTCVEYVLASLGYQFAGPDEFFDTDSANSVKAYQRGKGLKADGIVGPVTGGRMGVWANAPAAPAPAPAPAPELSVSDGSALPLGGCMISSSVRYGTRSSDGFCVERILAGLGYQFAGPDEYFDTDSANSVKAFQRGNGLQADGVVGPITGGRMGIWLGGPAPTPAAAPAPAPDSGAYGLPANSGSGRRIVYHRGQQQIWAVESDGTVVKTHRVSGRTREPYAGTYSVYSRSMYTYSQDNPDVKWRYMVRFAYGPNGGRIGFHEIPNKFGVPLQSESQLGQPLSGGCVRQSTPDAQWMWNWAGIGTKVVVL